MLTSTSPSPSSTSPSLPAIPRPLKTIFSRYEHGEVPVLVYDPSTPPLEFTGRVHRGSRGVYEVRWQDSYDSMLQPLGTRFYASASKLLTALYNRGHVGADCRSPGLSFDRYFGIALSPSAPIGAQIAPIGAAPTSGDLLSGILDLFGSHPVETLVPLHERKPPAQSPSTIRTRSSRDQSSRQRRCPPEAGRWYRPMTLGVVASVLALFGGMDADGIAVAANSTPVMDTADTPMWVSTQPEDRDLTADGLHTGLEPVPDAPSVGSPLVISTEAASEDIPETKGVIATSQCDHLEAAPAEAASATATGIPDSGLTVAAGIDLEGRSHEVKLLLHAGFARKMHSKGYNPDDVLQEVYKGLLTRNNGMCPWDGRKSSFGHYVYMVCNCILKNYHRKQSRRRDHEQSGILASPSQTGERNEDGRWNIVDAAIVAPDSLENSSSTYDDAATDLAMIAIDDWLRELVEDAENKGKTGEKAAYEFTLARICLPLKAKGMTRAEIAAETDLPVGVVSKALARLREGTREWAIAEGLRTA